MKPGIYKLFPLLLAFVCSAPGVLWAAERHEQTVQDLPYGLALYQFFQDQQLAAITELDAGAERGTLVNQPEDAELLKGGLYYTYGLAGEAEGIFRKMLDENTDSELRDRIWFNLAKLHYNQAQYQQSLDLLTQIQDDLVDPREDEKNYLLSNLYLRNSQFDLAIEATNKIDRNSIWRPYSEYNLGISLTQSGQPQQGSSWLAKVNQFESDDPEILALQDAALFAIGLDALKQKDADLAIDNFYQIRLSGPLSNKALLGTGWAWSLKGEPAKALDYWLTLKQNGQFDRASHEAILAAASAIEQKGDKAVAIQYYDQAARDFDIMLERLDQAIKNIEQFELIEALHTNRLVHDDSGQGLDFPSLNITSTPYLHQLFASQDFQLEVRHYQELLNIQSTLNRWDNNLPVLQLMLDERTRSFENKKPLLQQTTSFDELQELRNKRDEYAQQVASIENKHDYLALANEDETDYLEQLDEIRTFFDTFGSEDDFSGERDKFRLLSGLLHYQIEVDFPRRFWKVKRELILLDRALEQAGKSAQSLASAADLNETKLADFASRIQGQEQLIKSQREQVAALISRQQQLINSLAIAELESQKRNIGQLRLSARYSLARLYDDISQQEKAQ